VQFSVELLGQHGLSNYTAWDILVRHFLTPATQAQQQCASSTTSEKDFKTISNQQRGTCFSCDDHNWNRKPAERIPVHWLSRPLPPAPPWPSPGASTPTTTTAASSASASAVASSSANAAASSPSSVISSTSASACAAVTDSASGSSNSTTSTSSSSKSEVQTRARLRRPQLRVRLRPHGQLGRCHHGLVGLGAVQFVGCHAAGYDVHWLCRGGGRRCRRQFPLDQ
jgi:hypothetical protein